MKRRRSASERAKSRTRLDAEVSDSAMSCSRVEPVKVESAKPGGASSATRVSPSWMAKGAAAQCSETAARMPASVRTSGILAPGYHSGFRTRGNLERQHLGGNSQFSSQRGKGRHRLLWRPRH